MISFFSELFLTRCSFLYNKQSARVSPRFDKTLSVSPAVTCSVVFIKLGFLSLTFIKVSSNLAFWNEASSHSN